MRGAWRIGAVVRVSMVTEDGGNTKVSADADAEPVSAPSLPELAVLVAADRALACR